MREDSVEIWFPVEKDAAGHPNQEWEQLYAWPVQGGYRLNNVPFFAKDLALDDVVTARKGERGLLVFDRVVSRSGHSTFRIWLSAQQEQASGAIMNAVRDLGGHAEMTLDRLIAVDAPPERESRIWDYLEGGQQRGDWDLQVGYSPDQ